MKTTLSFLLLFTFLVSCTMHSTENNDGSTNISQENTSKKSPKISKNKSKKNRTKKTFVFNATNKPLVDLINELASEKYLNIILPQGALAITAKINYQVKEKMTIDAAWNRTLDILALLGYTVRPEADDMLTVVKNDGPNNAREPFSVYIDSPLPLLPDTPEVIKALFYLTNLSIKISGNDLMALLKDMLSSNADIKMDPKTNALILTDKSINIKNVMKIIQELDQSGIRDSIEILPLYYTSAQVLDDLFNKQLLAPDQSIVTGNVSGNPSYFPKNTKIIGLERTNSLVIMGTPSGIDAVKDFIIKYIDRPLESGESILHVYELKYLNAIQFAPILQQIVTPGQRDQATGKVAGPQQYFKDVIVQAELVRKTELIQPTQPGGTPTGATQPIAEGAQIGGNRLIVAARKKDWVRIKKLIENLDKPQPQVAIEVLIVDLTLSKDKIAASQIRNKSGVHDTLAKNIDFQMANIGAPIVGQDVVGTTPAGDPVVEFAGGLMANLLQFFPNNPGTNLANDATPGSLIISLNDRINGVWGLFQVLNQFANTTILAQPFVVTTNHQQATVTIQEERLLPGDADTSNNAVAVKFETVVAGLTVDILPHISLTNNINLQVTVNLNQFNNNVSNNRNTRVVQTSANVGNGQILALGGLVRQNDNINITQLSPLSKIPIFGWLFKGEEKVTIKNNLMIFICPTVIEPRLQGGIDDYTEKKLAFTRSDIDDHLAFENLKDPITRWFFQPDKTYGERVIKDYTHAATHTENEKDEFYFNVIRPNMRKALANNDNTANPDAEKLKLLVMNEENPVLNVSSN